MKYTEYEVNGYVIHVVSGKLTDLRLLNTSYAKLSSIRCSEGTIDAIINCSYFVAGQYALGRNQGDEINETSSWDEQGYLAVSVSRDGSYMAGKLSYWDGAQNAIAGFTPATISYLNGQKVKLLTTSFGYNTYDAKMNLATGVSMFAILDDKKTALLITAQRGITGNNVVDYLSGIYKFDLLCTLDGGGSSEMIVENKRMQVSTDGTAGRSMYNGLAFISKTAKPNLTSNTWPWLERLSWNGMTDNYQVHNTNEVAYGSPFWYDINYDRYARDGLRGPNCTWYCAGRSSEIANQPLGTSIPGGNAKTWWTTTTWPKGDTPKVGAVCVWGASQDTYGHVAIVERINDDGTVIVSQSNYTRASADQMNQNYFQLETYSMTPGYVTRGVGYTFLGYIYNPYINDIRVERDADKSQVEVLTSKIKARNNPSGDWYEGLYVAPGTYNILDGVVKDDFIWLKIADGVWFASNDEEGWTSTCIINQAAIEAPEVEEPEENVAAPITDEQVETYQDEIVALKTQLDIARANLIVAQNNIDELKQQLIFANKQISSLVNNQTDGSKKLQMIKEIIEK